MDDNFRYLIAIAEYGSISKAAQAVHMSQSALSQRLKNEELALGAELFDRSHNPICPTPAGALYLIWAHQMEAAEVKLHSSLSQLTDGVQRILNVGISAPRLSAVIGAATTRFCQTHPECRINFVDVGRRESVNEAFKKQEIDFAILTPQQPEPSLCKSRPICVERYYFIVSSDLKVPVIREEDGLGVVATSTIGAFPLILPGYARRAMEVAETVAESCETRPRIVASCANASTLRQLVAAGVGCSVVSAATRDGEDEGITYYAVDGLPGLSYLYYSRRYDHPMTADEEVFVGLVTEELTARGLYLAQY